MKIWKWIWLFSYFFQKSCFLSQDSNGFSLWSYIFSIQWTFTVIDLPMIKSCLGGHYCRMHTGTCSADLAVGGRGFPWSSRSVACEAMAQRQCWASSEFRAVVGLSIAAPSAFFRGENSSSLNTSNTTKFLTKTESFCLAVETLLPVTNFIRESNYTIPWEWKYIKNKLFHLNPIGFGGFDLIATWIHKRHFLLCNMLFQLAYEFSVRWK